MNAIRTKQEIKDKMYKVKETNRICIPKYKIIRQKNEAENMNKQLKKRRYRKNPDEKEGDGKYLRKQKKVKSAMCNGT